MKSMLITYDQAYDYKVLDILSKFNIRGYTEWTGIFGQGSKTGEPHLGTHAWPGLNNAIISIMDDEKVKPVLKALRELDAESELLGVRAFVWNIEDGM